MKKVLTVLVVLMVTAAAVFAVTNDKLYVTSTVAGADPVFQMKGSVGKTFDKTASDAGYIAGGANVIAAAADISAADVKVYVQVNQTAQVKFKSTSAFDISVTATELKLDGTSDTYKTALPTIGEVASYTTDANLSVAPATAGATQKWTLNYLTGAPVAATEIGQFAYTWASVATLAKGTYRADITLTYTVQ